MSVTFTGRDSSSNCDKMNDLTDLISKEVRLPLFLPYKETSFHHIK